MAADNGEEAFVVAGIWKIRWDDGNVSIIGREADFFLFEEATDRQIMSMGTEGGVLDIFWCVNTTRIGEACMRFMQTVRRLRAAKEAGHYDEVSAPESNYDVVRAFSTFERIGRYYNGKMHAG